jgi:hypothetical protein
MNDSDIIFMLMLGAAIVMLVGVLKWLWQEPDRTAYLKEYDEGKINRKEMNK